MLKKVLYYLNPLTLFKEKKEGEATNKIHQTMDIVNRISIYLFLFCIILIIKKLM